MDNILTPRFRASYAYVFRPQKAMEAGKDPKYSLTMLFDKGADLSKLRDAASAVAKEKWGPDQTKWPKNLRVPFRDQGEKDSPGYVEGAVFLTATTKQKPGLLNERKEPIIEESEFYSGCYAIATVRPFAYDTNGNRGVSFGLQNVMKMKDGEPLAGRAKPEDDFEDVAVSSEGGEAKSTDSVFG